MESFEEVVLNSMKRNEGKRDFHLLLGNGFSMAYDAKIFSYNALHDFVSKQDDEVLEALFNVVETRNFELIMRQLRDFESFIEAFDKKNLLKTKVVNAQNSLKKSLLSAVKSLHPEHVFEMAEEKSAACARFIKHFLDAGGHVFTTNYDLLLYWVLMRNMPDDHADGFGRYLLNPDDPKEDWEWSELTWGKNKEKQNVHYVHGALPFFDNGIDIQKEEYDNEGYLLDNISRRIDENDYPIFVTAGDGNDKLAHIRHNSYLTYCYDALCEVTGTVVVFGFGFGSYDGHVIEALNKACKLRSGRKLYSVYIGVHDQNDVKHYEQVAERLKAKVRLFDASTANVWG